METWMIVILALMVIIILGLVVFLLTRYFKSTPIREEANFILSFFPHKHNGRAFGRIETVDEGPDKQKIITFQPQDLSLKEIMDDATIPNETIIVNNGKLISLSKGLFSKGRYIDLALPPKSEDFPKEIANTPFGKMLQFYVELDNAENTEVSSLRNGIESIELMVKEMAGGEVSKTHLMHFTGLFKDWLDMMKETKKDKTVPTMATFGQTSQ
jgi:hypothetical protein